MSTHPFLPELGHRTEQHFATVTCPGLTQKGKPDKVTVKITKYGEVKACLNRCLGCAVPKEKRPDVCLVGKKTLETYIR